MNIEFEKEVVSYLGLPSLPKKEWDGKTNFDKGVAIIEFRDGRLAYAACEMNADKGHNKPKVTKVFSLEPFISIKKAFVVPSYMNTIDEVAKMDLDEESKKKAEQLLQEAEELENDGIGEGSTVDNLPEWVFEEITNREEAEAWLRRYNARHRIKGKVPRNEETLKLRLLSIYSEKKKS